MYYSEAKQEDEGNAFEKAKEWRERICLVEIQCRRQELDKVTELL